MRPAGVAPILVAMVVVLAAIGNAQAQTRIGGMNVEGSVETGGQVFLTDGPTNRQRAKFEEYRDIEAGPMLQSLQLRFFTDDEGYSSEFFGSKWGRQDQEYSLRAGRTGLWEFEFDWDQIPHVISTTARTSLHQQATGVWTLPTIRALSDFNGQATSHQIDVGVRWDTGHFKFKLTPTADSELFLEYTRIRKEGTKPFSMNFGTGSGTNFLELVRPIEETVHDIRLGGSIARENWQLQFVYTLSLYENDHDRVKFDNPCFQAPIGGSVAFGCIAGESRTAANNVVPAAGQSSLPPSNMAHMFNLSAGVNLPLRTRVTANASYTLALQDQRFLPFTINPSIAGLPELALRQRSLDGNVQTIVLNTGVTSRPFDLPLTLSAKYRMYDLTDRSDTVVYTSYGIGDRAVVVGGALVPTRNLAGTTHQSFTRHNVDIDGRYQFGQVAATTVGFGWEEWIRGPAREVHETDEYFVKAALDVTPAEWFLGRLTYKPSFRRDTDYNRFLISGRNPTNQIFLGRKFDEAERDRQRVDLLLQFTPVETLSISPTASWRWDDYIHSAFGITWETAWTAGIDISFRPAEWLTFSAGYVHEVIDRDLNSRGASPNQVANINKDWLSNMADTYDTVYIAARAALIPGVLDWSVGANYAGSSGTITTRNPSATIGGTALALNALAKGMPAFDDTLWRIDTALRYHISKAWTASLTYAFESFEKHDWRTDDWLAWDPILRANQGVIYLGNDTRDYTAHLLGLTFAYRFK